MIALQKSDEPKI